MSATPPDGRAPRGAVGRVRSLSLPVALAVAGALLVGWWWTSQPLPDAGALTSSELAAEARTEEIAVPSDAGALAADPLVSAPMRQLPYAVARPAVPEAAPEVVAPVTLRGDALDGDVPLDAVGARDGAMALPHEGSRVGWYRFGAVPGAPAGSAVLAGHVDTWDGGPGALAGARDLEVGDRLQVALADGSVVDYAVTARVNVGKDALPVDDLFDRDGAPRLVLITCGGAWQEDLRSYTDNVVVTADPA